MIQRIETDKAARAVGPYSQGIVCGNLLFTSGQLPLDPQTDQMPGQIEQQVERVMLNLQAIAREAGSDLDKTVKTMCFLADMSYFNTFNEIYARYFTGKPARSCVAVKALPKGALVEVEAIIALA